MWYIGGMLVWSLVCFSCGVHHWRCFHAFIYKFVKLNGEKADKPASLQGTSACLHLLLSASVTWPLSLQVHQESLALPEQQRSSTAHQQDWKRCHPSACHSFSLCFSVSIIHHMFSSAAVASTTTPLCIMLLFFVTNTRNVPNSVLFNQLNLKLCIFYSVIITY